MGGSKRDERIAHSQKGKRATTTAFIGEGSMKTANRKRQTAKRDVCR